MVCVDPRLHDSPPFGETTVMLLVAAASEKFALLESVMAGLLVLVIRIL